VSESIGGKTYCFGNEAARAEFMKDPEGNVAKAQSAYQAEKAG
jgi:YHS domain-containing protein